MIKFYWLEIHEGIIILFIVKLNNNYKKIKRNEEWNGDWSDNSHKWTEELKKTLEYTN